jgi:trimethyllysine dioxygenase
VPRYARLQSTEVAPVPPLQTVSSKEPLKTTVVPKPVAKKTLPQKNQVLSKENGSSPSKVHSDLKKVDEELHALREQRRKLASMLDRTTRVRTEYGSAEPETTNAHITFANNKVSLDGKVFPNIWLRDNCQCSSCMHESTKQRLQDTFAIPRDLSIKAASCTKDMEASKTQISIEWSDGHKSTYHQPFLANAVASLDSRAVTRQGLAPTELWTSEISRHKPMVSYSEAVRENMGPVLRQLVSYSDPHLQTPT